MLPMLEMPGPCHLHICVFVHRFMCFSEDGKESVQAQQLRKCETKKASYNAEHSVQIRDDYEKKKD